MKNRITEFFGDFSLIFAANAVLFYDLTKYLKKKYQNLAYSISFFCVFLRFCRVQRCYRRNISKREVLNVNRFPLVVFLRK
ncbi:MAG: hypothetical protein IKV22_05505 [Paludibacteraceae bacterium]|nr:hypothetical protein [Paludibacteraceae bacterium]